MTQSLFMDNNRMLNNLFSCYDARDDKILFGIESIHSHVEQNSNVKKDSEDEFNNSKKNKKCEMVDPLKGNDTIFQLTSSGRFPSSLRIRVKKPKVSKPKRFSQQSKKNSLSTTNAHSPISGIGSFMNSKRKDLEQNPKNIISLGNFGNPLILSTTPEKSPMSLSHRKLTFISDFERFHEKKRFEFFNEFKRNSRLLQQFENNLWLPSRTMKGTLKMVPKSSQHPGTLYNSKNLSEEEDKGDTTIAQVETKSKEFYIENCDEMSTNKKSAITKSSEYSSFVNKVKCSNMSKKESEMFDASIKGSCKQFLIPKSIFIINEPVKLKYIDEAIGQTKNMLIYTDEFLQTITGEENTVSERDILEKLFERSENYEGRNLRVIIDIEKYFSDQYRTLEEKNTISDRTSLTTHLLASTPNQSSRIPRIKKASIESHPFHKTGSQSKWQNTLQKTYLEENVETSFKSNFNGQYAAPNNSARNSKFEQDRNNPQYKVPRDKQISRIALKRINTEEIIASDFRHFFHAYAKLGGRLKSGAAISKLNTDIWLRRGGITFDDTSQKIADECFAEVARRKLVLNIGDFVQFLVAVARRRRLILQDVVYWLTNVDPPLLNTIKTERKSVSDKSSELESLSTQTQEFFNKDS